MRFLYLAVVILVLAFVSAKHEKGKFEVEGNLFGEKSPIKLLMEGMIKDGSNTELMTYLKVFNQVYPLVKAFTDSVDPTRGEAIKEYKYQYCIRTQRGDNIACFDFVWNFVVGWRAEQFHDTARFYNLTVTPYAFMSAEMSVSTQADPAQINFGPKFNFVDFSAPLSFEMEDRETLCYSGALTIAPVVMDVGLSAKFLECEIMIPEDTHNCNWTERMGARFFYAELNDGYHSELLERTCIHAS